MENIPPEISSASNASSIPPPLPSKEDQSWAIALHLSGFAGLPLPPLGQILAPLIIWLLKRSQSAYLDYVGKEVLNFQISYTIYTVLATALCYLCIGFIFLPVVFVLWIIFMIIAAVKTSNGEGYAYPLTIKFLR